MTDPLLPTADAIVGPALSTMYSLRPKSFQHLNYRTGAYWHPFLAFRGQAAASLKRLSDLIKANRLGTAEGQELLDYVASEYDAIPDLGQTYAIGEVTLSRPTAAAGAGEIPKGTKIVRSANLTTQLPFQAADYETLVNVHFDASQTVTGLVPIIARTPGAAANHPLRTDGFTPNVVVSGGSLFDTTIAVASFNAGGGSDDVPDAYVRRFAKAYAMGQFGPTADASRYGSLRASGVRRMLVYDIPGTGNEQILIADQSWGSSPRWAAQVQQSLIDNDLVGFGCKVVVSQVRNKIVSVNATIVLRDKNYLAQTSDVDEAVRSAVKAYLDERPDWNVWKQAALKAAITNAHPKIFNCTSVAMLDVTGATVSEIATPNYTTEQFHYALASGAMQLTYVGPS